MSNVLNVIKLRNAKSDFKMLVVLAFCFVAMSFFAIGFVYAQAPEIGILVKLLAIMRHSGSDPAVVLTATIALICLAGEISGVRQKLNN